MKLRRRWTFALVGLSIDGGSSLVDLVAPISPSVSIILGLKCGRCAHSNIAVQNTGKGPTDEGLVYSDDFAHLHMPSLIVN